MAELPYWAQNWFATHEIKNRFQRLKHQVQDAREESASDLRSILSVIDQLEVDVGRALLKVQAIVDVLEQKGVVTTEELAAKANDLDALDGEMDGILHPAVFRTKQEQARTPSKANDLDASGDAASFIPRCFVRSRSKRDPVAARLLDCDGKGDQHAKRVSRPFGAAGRR